jgi:Zn-dependent peptidase ImmA (M78 family)
MAKWASMWLKRNKKRIPAPPTPQTASQEDEEYANAFAAALLMPKSEVVTRVKRGYNTHQLAANFGVPVSRMKDRLIDLGLYDQSTDTARPGGLLAPPRRRS